MPNGIEIARSGPNSSAKSSAKRCPIVMNRVAGRARMTSRRPGSQGSIARWWPVAPAQPIVTSGCSVRVTA